MHLKRDKNWEYALLSCTLSERSVTSWQIMYITKCLRKFTSILGSHTEEMICTLCKNKIGEAIKHVQETVDKPTLWWYPKGKSSLGQPLPWSSKDTEQSASTIPSYPEVMSGGAKTSSRFYEKKSFDRFSWRGAQKKIIRKNNARIWIKVD